MYRRIVKKLFSFHPKNENEVQVQTPLGTVDLKYNPDNESLEINANANVPKAVVIEPENDRLVAYDGGFLLMGKKANISKDGKVYQKSDPNTSSYH
jgi:hypothetical protein